MSSFFAALAVGAGTVGFTFTGGFARSTCFGVAALALSLFALAVGSAVAVLTVDAFFS